MNQILTVETTVKGDNEIVWNLWTEPEHITQWMHASDDWECPRATNDVRLGGTFSFTLSAKDKSTSFDFNGVYTAVEPGKLLVYTIEDGRTATVSFTSAEGAVHIVENFEMEHENSEELQVAGWQAMLDNFKKYAEGR